MLLSETIARQARSPAGPLGRIVAWFMARETARENDVAVGFLAPPADGRILEVGCGHGRTLRLLARLVPEGQVVGVDGSPTMLGIAGRRNATALRSGRVRLLRADSVRLPLPGGAFDGALAVHVVYFWPDPLAHLREIRRVLRPGGRLVLCFRTRSDALTAGRFPPSVYTFYEGPEIEGLLRRAGFRVVEIHERRLDGRHLAWAVATPEETSLPSSGAGAMGFPR